MKVNILGTEYKVSKLSEAEYPKLKICDASGLCELYSKEIIIDQSIISDGDRAFTNIEEYEKKVLRHEIAHAFLFESGLVDYCNDEKLVDWIAVQFPKILKAFQEAECL